VEVDRGREVRRIPEAAGLALDAHDLAVQAFGDAVAAVWCPGGAPLIVSPYYTESPLPPEGRDIVLANVGHIAAGPLQ
jgi:hypothetical protein